MYSLQRQSVTRLLAKTARPVSYKTICTDYIKQKVRMNDYGGVNKHVTLRIACAVQNLAELTGILLSCLKLENLLCCTCRAGYYRPDCSTVENLVEDGDDVLFRRVLNNQHHLLHSLLADKNSHAYDLRRRRHDRILSPEDDQRNFVHRQIHKYRY